MVCCALPKEVWEIICEYKHHLEMKNVLFEMMTELRRHPVFRRSDGVYAVGQYLATARPAYFSQHTRDRAITYFRPNGNVINIAVAVVTGIVCGVQPTNGGWMITIKFLNARERDENGTSITYYHQ